MEQEERITEGEWGLGMWPQRGGCRVTVKSGSHGTLHAGLVLVRAAHVCLYTRMCTHTHAHVCTYMCMHVHVPSYRVEKPTSHQLSKSS